MKPLWRPVTYIVITVISAGLSKLSGENQFVLYVTLSSILVLAGDCYARFTKNL